MNKRLEEKINESIKVFKKAYTKNGFFSWNFGKGPFNENPTNYHKALDHGHSKIVGNSSFSPRIRMLPVYNEGQKYGIPHHYRWVLSVHPRLNNGIKEVITPDKLKEIELDVENMKFKDVIDVIRDFLTLSNEEVMKKFEIEPSTFSLESLALMRIIDRRNKLMYQTEESLEEFKANNLQAKDKEEHEEDNRIVIL